MTKRGRPALPAEDKRVPFTVRMTPFAIEEIRRAASRDKKDPSEWVREKLRLACDDGGRAVP